MAKHVQLTSVVPNKSKPIADELCASRTPSLGIIKMQIEELIHNLLGYGHRSKRLNKEHEEAFENSSANNMSSLIAKPCTL
jgi:hypothetical protein